MKKRLFNKYDLEFVQGDENEIPKEPGYVKYQSSRRMEKEVRRILNESEQGAGADDEDDITPVFNFGG